MKEILLKLLRETDTYVSGQQICEELHVSRTAVWKWIKQLKEDGYKIESVTGKGYRLMESPNAITKEEILSKLQTKVFGRELYYYDSVDSTNEEAKRLSLKGCSHGTLVVAEEQTKGKGRRGHIWVSPKGKDIFMTLYLKPEFEAVHASMLTLLAALSIVEAVEEDTGLSCEIKWPNDLVHNGKKLTGILTEMSTDMEYINYVLIGIGININNPSFAPEIKDMASSLFLESGEEVNRAKLAADVLKYMEKNYNIFVKTKDLSGLLENYNKHLVNIGKQVKIIQNGEERIGTSHGIDKNGGLIVDFDGKKETIISGEVSVRGLYGYV